jgi:hypothetical protein
MEPGGKDFQENSRIAGKPSVTPVREELLTIRSEAVVPD